MRNRIALTLAICLLIPACTSGTRTGQRAYTLRMEARPGASQYERPSLLALRCLRR
jgi:hypothetical protein